MALKKNNKTIDPTARVIHEALEQLGWSDDPQALADRVRRLDLGLPAEDEFSALLSWLGRCQLVHKLDQLQVPAESKRYYRVPDLLAIFEHQESTTPVLIEVKSGVSESLSWRPDYFEGLQRYAKKVGIPILVAWKWHTLWTLFELTHFIRPKKNYKITLEKAIKENLMGILAGDFSFVLQPGVGLHFKSYKEEKLGEKMEGNKVVGEDWRLRIEDAYFTRDNGERINELGQGLWSLFLCTNFEEYANVEDEYIYHGWLVPEETPQEFAHRALVILLKFRSSEENAIRWRKILEGHDFPILGSELKKSALEGIHQGVVRYVFDQVPQTLPSFMAD